MDELRFTVGFKGTKYPANYIKTVEKTEIILAHLMQKDVLFGIDTETYPIPKYAKNKKAGLSPHLANIRLIQVFDGKVSYVFDMYYIKDYSLFVPFLEAKRFIAHNAKFDLQFFMKIGVKNMNLGCTLILARLLFHATYPTDEGLSASLANLSKALFDIDISKADQASGWDLAELNMGQIEYSALDPILCLKIAERLSPGLSKFKLERSYSLLKDAQHPICAIECNGFRIDAEKHRDMIPVWKDEMYRAKKEVLALTGLSDITPMKVGKWLEENLEEEVKEFWPRTESGKFATDANTFSDFSWLDIAKPFAKYQKLVKITSTYGNKLLNMINPETGRLHSKFNMTGARTGRLASSEPNIQNLPRDKKIRANFIPRKGYEFHVADYSQIELRVAAELSQDKVMLHAYRNGIDLHRLTASRVTKKALEEVTDEDRQRAKAINFGFLFGLGAKKYAHYAKVSYKVEITEDQAFEDKEIYQETYAGYHEWQMSAATRARKTLYSRTPCGKLRRMAEDNTYGAGMNTPVQGGAAEIMLYALIKIHKMLLEAELDAYLVNVVHDEIIVEARKKDREMVQFIIQECMREAYLEVFPNGITRDLAEALTGDNWASAKDKNKSVDLLVDAA